MILVIDASVAVKWFVKEAHRPAALAVLHHTDAVLHAPDWIASEVSHALFRKWLGNQIPVEQARIAVSSLPRYFSQLHRSAALISQAFDLALEISHPVYDCLYLACAQTVDGTVLTADNEFLKSVGETRYRERVQPLESLA